MNADSGTIALFMGAGLLGWVAIRATADLPEIAVRAMWVAVVLGAVAPVLLAVGETRGYTMMLVPLFGGVAGGELLYGWVTRKWLLLKTRPPAKTESPPKKKRAK
jgi:hypothetical protein